MTTDLDFYLGVPRGDGRPRAQVFYVTGGDMRTALPHVVKHSPSGFEWGYNGSGPSDLALSLLCHAASLLLPPPLGMSLYAPPLTPQRMLEVWGVQYVLVENVYQEFRREVIAKLAPGVGWMIPRTVVEPWVSESWSVVDGQHRTPSYLS